MKFLKLILAVALMAMPAMAQQVIGPAGTTALTTNMLLVSTATTNLAISPWVKSIPVGKDGVGIQFSIWCPSNATTGHLTVTNCQMLFQGSADGLNWITSPASAAAIGMNGITVNSNNISTSYTNIIASQVPNNIGNLRYIRSSWFTNQNGTNWIYISNIVVNAR